MSVDTLCFIIDEAALSGLAVYLLCLAARAWRS
jgi:hypothetical protein